MGSHSWTTSCPCCDSEGMIVSSFNSLYFEANCPFCGYSTWTEEKAPIDSDVDLIKIEIARMNEEERQKVIENYCEDNISLIEQLRSK